MALADLLVRIGVDASEFDSGIKKLSTNATAAIGASASAIDSASATVARSVGNLSKSLAEQQASLKDIGKQYSEGAISATQFFQAAGNTVDLSRSATESANLESQLGKLTKRFDSGRISINEYKAKLGELKQAQEKAAASTKSIFDGLSKVGQQMKSIGSGLVAGVSLPIAGLAVAATSAFGEIDSLKRALQTLEGSAANTERRFKELNEIAKLPGLGLEQAVRADIRLRNFGFTTAQSTRILQEFGNAIAKAGGGAGDLEEVTRQLGQLAARGQVTADNLKPIIERVPQAADALKRLFGTVDSEQLSKKLEGLGLSSKDFINILVEDFSKGSRVVGGIKNDLENLANDSKLAMAELGAAIEPAATAFAQNATKIVNSFKNMAVEFQGAPKVFKDAAAYVAGIAFVGPFAIVAIGTVLTNLTRIKQALEAIRGTALTTQQTLRTLAPFLVFREVTPPSIDAFAEFATDSEDLQRRLSVNIPKLNASAEQLRASLQSLNNAVKNGAVKQVDAAPSIKAIEDQLRSMGEPLISTTQNFRMLGGEIEKFAKTGGAIKFIEKDAVFAALAAEQMRRYEEGIRAVTKARLDLAEGKGIVIDFGPPPEVSKFTEKLPKIILDVGFKFPELTALNDSIFSDQVNEVISGIEQKERSKGLDKYLAGLKEEFKKTGKEGSKAMQQVSLAITQTARGIADAIFQGGKFGDKMVSVAKEIGKGLTQYILETLGKSILSMKTLRSLFTDIGAAFKKTISSALNGVTTAFAGAGTGAALGATAGAGTTAAVAGAGAAAAVIPQLPGGGYGNIPQLPPPTTVPAGGGVASATGSLINTVSGVVTAISSVFSAVSGFFQGSETNNTLDRVVLHTLQTANDLANLRRDLFEWKAQLFAKVDDVWAYQRTQMDTLIQSVRVNPITVASGAGGATYNISINAGAVVDSFAVPRLIDLIAEELRRRRIGV